MLDLETMDKIMNEEATDLHEEELEKFKVFADVECQLDETNTFIFILLCTREDEDEIHYHWGRDCIKQFIKAVLEWVKPEEEGDPRKKPHIF